MIITLTPSRCDAALTAARAGDDLILNGVRVTLPTYQAGSSPWIIGAPDLKDGVWHLDLVLPHGATPPQETLFPDPIRVDQDGDIDLPAFDGLVDDADDFV